MRAAVPLTALTALILAAALLPTAMGHAAPDPLSVETHLIHDEGEDAFYWVDGYDLYNVHAREAYLPSLDAEGVIFRLDLYGGFTPQPTVDALHIEVGAGEGDNATALRMTTTNDRNWTGDLHVFHLNVTEDQPPFTGVTARMQLFATYEQLGVEKGGALDSVWLKSYAGDDVVDVAPGGYYLPGSGGSGEVPSDSERLVDSLPLNGPKGYTNSTATTATGQVTLTVTNALEENGQHVTLRPRPTAGWNATLQGPAAASVDAGKSHAFTLNVTAAPGVAAPLALDVVTDLGGLETWHVGVNGTLLEVAQDPAGLAVDARVDKAEETPLPLWLAWVALGATAALIAGRRR